MFLSQSLCHIFIVSSQFLGSLPYPTHMKIKSLYFITLIGTWIVTIILYFWFIRTPYFEAFNIWTRHNLVIFYVSLLLAKILAIVWPPLPGSLFTFGAIPFIGWFQSYLVDLVGSLIGASIAYFLGKKYGYPFLAKIFNVNILQKIQQIKIRKDREIESIFIGRMAGAGNIMELVCYGAGVLRVRFSSFIIASFLANLFALPLYYAGGNILKGGNIILGIIFGAVTLFVFWKIKGRYIE